MVAILALDVSGVPRKWISVETAIIHHAKKQIAWSLGDDVALYRGGTRRIDGERSQISTPSIIAIKSNSYIPNKLSKVLLTNKTLFARDRHTCAYCGKVHDTGHLSRDHIVPVSKGGLDTWMNVVSACKKCNCNKSDMTLEQAGMELLFVPYVPTYAESLILQNRRILADQHDFLAAMLPKHSRVLTLS